MGKLSKSDRAHLSYMWLRDAHEALKRAHDAHTERIRRDGLTDENAFAMVKMHGPTLSRLLQACRRAMALEKDPFGVCFLENGKASAYSIPKKLAIVAEVKARAYQIYQLSGDDASEAAKHVQQAIEDVAHEHGLSGTDNGTVQKWCDEYWPFVHNPE